MQPDKLFLGGDKDWDVEWTPPGAFDADFLNFYLVLGLQPDGKEEYECLCVVASSLYWENDDSFCWGTVVLDGHEGEEKILTSRGVFYAEPPDPLEQYHDTSVFVWQRFYYYAVAWVCRYQRSSPFIRSSLSLSCIMDGVVVCPVSLFAGISVVLIIRLSRRIGRILPPTMHRLWRPGTYLDR